MIHCKKGRVSVSTFTNQYCQGQPELTHDYCYLSNYDESDVNKRCVETTRNLQDDGDDDDQENKEYYMFGCEFAPGFTYMSENGAKEANSMNIHILIGTILSIVCVLGIVFGYLLHRNKKKTAENTSM